MRQKKTDARSPRRILRRGQAFPNQRKGTNYLSFSETKPSPKVPRIDTSRSETNRIGREASVNLIHGSLRRMGRRKRRKRGRSAKGRDTRFAHLGDVKAFRLRGGDQNCIVLAKEIRFPFHGNVEPRGGAAFCLGNDLSQQNGIPSSMQRLLALEGARKNVCPLVSLFVLSAGILYREPFSCPFKTGGR